MPNAFSPYPRRVTTYGHGGGSVIPLNDAEVLAQDVTDFVDGNFEAIQTRANARTHTVPPQSYGAVEARRIARSNYYHRMLSSETSAVMIASALEQIMLAATLRRASLVRQHQEIYDNTTNDRVKRLVWLRLLDLKQRTWFNFISRDLMDSLVRVFEQASASITNNTELRDRFDALNEHVKRARRLGVARNRSRTPRWAWR
jgi:hypothetical protein